MNICLLFLTCDNIKEADSISSILLEKKLITCAKKFTVSSSFLWKGKISNAEEVMLIMESIKENYARIEKEIAAIHSYDSFVLLSVPVADTTAKVRRWMTKELH